MHRLTRFPTRCLDRLPVHDIDWRPVALGAAISLVGSSFLLDAFSLLGVAPARTIVLTLPVIVGSLAFIVVAAALRIREELTATSGKALAALHLEEAQVMQMQQAADQNDGVTSPSGLVLLQSQGDWLKPPKPGGYGAAIPVGTKVLTQSLYGTPIPGQEPLPPSNEVLLEHLHQAALATGAGCDAGEPSHALGVLAVVSLEYACGPGDVQLIAHGPDKGPTLGHVPCAAIGSEMVTLDHWYSPLQVTPDGGVRHHLTVTRGAFGTQAVSHAEGARMVILDGMTPLAAIVAHLRHMAGDGKASQPAAPSPKWSRPPAAVEW